MATLPSRVLDYPKIKVDGSEESLPGYLSPYRLLNRGKVRDTFDLPYQPDKLLVVASDRLSIFDFVLPALVPRKGAVLTALTHFWLTKVLIGPTNHLVPSQFNSRYNAAYDEMVDRGPEFPLERSLVVRKVQIQPYEMIFRHHLGGSVWKQYQKDGTVGGHQLPAGLTRWQRLDTPIFTPSTKEESGHDVNITAASYLEVMGELGGETVENLRRVYMQAYAWALERGIVILDTKFEVGNPYIIADEVLTPDSSRFTTVEDYEAAVAEGRDPVFYDKELVRQWGRTVPTPFGVTGINNLDPENPDHLAFVHNEVEVPEDVIAETADRYQQIFEMLARQPLATYQRNEMGVEA